MEELEMTFNEVRKDYLLNRWVVIATERSRRPKDFAEKGREKSKMKVCPLCPGNEHMTPPAVLLYAKSDENIQKMKDSDGSRPKNWLIRCVPNLYPAFSPPKEESEETKVESDDSLKLAIGHHEVLVESPIHDEHPAEIRISQLEHVIKAYVDRLRELSSKPYTKYVSIFRNHGQEAGASLSHAHSQIISTPLIPRIVEEEISAAKKFWKNKGKCIFCIILENELDGPRLIHKDQNFAAFSPWSSVHPMEFWIMPRRHENTLLEMSSHSVKALAKILKTCMSGLAEILNDPPYNYGFHLSIDETDRNYFHWHLEVYPRLAIWAGFEKSTGMYINTIAPEVAAESLRNVIK
jgi:UDPglucose--hexose-1-phosphate uridylyltransferase